MAPSNPVVTEAGEPPTYQHVEKVLSHAGGSDGEDTQENDSHGTDLRLTCEGPHDDWESNPRQKSAFSDPSPKDDQKEVFGVLTSENALKESTPKKPMPSQNQCSTSQVEVQTKAPSSEASFWIAESVGEHTPAEPNAEPKQHAEDVSSPPIAIVTVDQSPKERHSSTRNQTNLVSINMVLSEQQGNNDDSPVSISISRGLKYFVTTFSSLAPRTLEFSGQGLFTSWATKCHPYRHPCESAGIPSDPSCNIINSRS
jgi:hypothetical protein